MFDFLRAKLPIERSFYLIPRFAASICGFWPKSTYKWYRTLLFCFSTFVVAFGAFGEIIYGFVYLDHLTDALEAFCPGATKLICFFKMLIFFIHRQLFYQIIERMRKLLVAHATVQEKRQKIQKLAAVGNTLSFILMASGGSTGSAFIITPLIKMAYKALQGQAFEYRLPFNVVLPEMFTKYPFYPGTFCILTFSSAMTVFTFSAVDGFFVCGCIYACALFRMLQFDIQQICSQLVTHEHATVAENIKIRRKLAAIVEQHDVVIDLCKDFNALFQIIILLHFLSASLVLCFSILDLMLQFGSIGMYTYIFYSIAASTQLLLYCLGGNYVSESSLEIADTAYNIEWYKCDVTTRKMILMIIRRAQKPQTIAVPFFTPSLPAFRAIISTAGSYITLLKTFL